MKTIDILNKMDEAVGLHTLVRHGIISSSILLKRTIYLEVDIFMKMGHKKEQAVQLTCDKLNISRKSVYNSIKYIKHE